MNVLEEAEKKKIDIVPLGNEEPPILPVKKKKTRTMNEDLLQKLAYARQVRMENVVKNREKNQKKKVVLNKAKEKVIQEVLMKSDGKPESIDDVDHFIDGLFVKETSLDNTPASKEILEEKETIQQMDGSEHRNIHASGVGVEDMVFDLLNKETLFDSNLLNYNTQSYTRDGIIFL